MALIRITFHAWRGTPSDSRRATTKTSSSKVPAVREEIIGQKVDVVARVAASINTK